MQHSSSLWILGCRRADRADIPSYRPNARRLSHTRPSWATHSPAEGGLIIGLNKAAIGTLVERSSRFTMLLHLPPMDGHVEQPRVKNGAPLAGHGGEAVRDEIARVVATLHERLRRSLTWDQGAEMAQHAQLRIDTGLHRTTHRDRRTTLNRLDWRRLRQQPGDNGLAESVNEASTRPS